VRQVSLSRRASWAPLARPTPVTPGASACNPLVHLTPQARITIAFPDCGHSRPAILCLPLLPSASAAGSSDKPGKTKKDREALALHPDRVDKYYVYCDKSVACHDKQQRP